MPTPSRPTSTRRERARAERHDLILRTARELAEAIGWDAVTTRRLAEAVDYSQPVLYGHFKNMNAITDAIALEGIDELTAVLRTARETGGLRALAQAYLAFAAEHPAVYEAMFVRPTELAFGTPDSPAALKSAFAEFLAAVAPFAGDDPETLAEVLWSALHGQATLNHSTRLRPTHATARADLLVSCLSGKNSAPTAE
jgi:AcrR family transcriptional regulator